MIEDKKQQADGNEIRSENAAVKAAESGSDEVRLPPLASFRQSKKKG